MNKQSLKYKNTIYKYYLLNTKKHCTRLSLWFPMSFQIIIWRLILSFEFVAWLKLISGSFNLNNMFFFIQLLYHDFLPFFLLAILLSPFFMFDWLATDFWAQVSPLLSPFFFLSFSLLIQSLEPIFLLLAFSLSASLI